MIRRATPDDIPTLTRLNRVVQALHHEAHPERFKPPSDDLGGFYRSRFEDGAFAWVAERDGEAIGYVLALVRERAENPFCYGLRWVELDQIAVHPDARRNGVGLSLVGAVLRHAESLGLHVELGVWAFNARAQAAFTRAGFQALNRRMVHGHPGGIVTDS